MKSLGLTAGLLLVRKQLEEARTIHPCLHLLARLKKNSRSDLLVILLPLCLVIKVVIEISALYIVVVKILEATTCKCSIK